jgi:DNA-3-methyladenine glycosylase I
MQAGLSFESVIQKRNGLNDAFNNFNPCKVADYDEKKIDELMHDDRIIRNRKKIESIIYNAGMFLKIIAEYDSFLKWFEKSKRLTLDENVILFKKHFKFVGPEIVREFLESSGLVEKEHDKECFMHPNNTLIKKRKP